MSFTWGSADSVKLLELLHYSHSHETALRTVLLLQRWLFLYTQRHSLSHVGLRILYAPSQHTGFDRNATLFIDLRHGHSAFEHA